MARKPYKNKDKKNTLSDILNAAIVLFSKYGYAGVSMRDLAALVGITPGALYHYFSTKADLYNAVITYAYEIKTNPATPLLKPEIDVEPIVRMEKFILRLCERFYEDPIFRTLVQRCLAETIEEIQDILKEKVYLGHFKAMEELLAEIAPEYDSHMLAVSVYGLVMHNYNSLDGRKKLPKYNPKNDLPPVLTKHIMKLLKFGILPE